MTAESKEAKSLIKQLERLLNAEISLTPRDESKQARKVDPNPAGGGRVIYVPLPGTGSRFKLSPRAQQVFSFLTQTKKATALDLQSGLKVNRNVIAGAMHELRTKKAVRTLPDRRVQVAAGPPPVKERRKRLKQRPAREHPARRRKTKPPATDR